MKYPVPRTSWDGKPDFFGVYWPDATIAPPPVALESLYRSEAREYREGGGAARDLIDWRGIDTPNYHCWPPSPVDGSMGGTVQLVSAPGYLLLLNEGGSYFRIIPIVGENGRQPSASRKPSFQGSSVGHWEGDSLVVEVTNFNGKPWLGGAQPPNRLPQTSSDALRIVERWSRPDAQIFEYRVVVEDPRMLTAPRNGLQYSRHGGELARGAGPRRNSVRAPADRTHTNFNSGAFGRSTSMAGASRIMQFGVKYGF